MIVIVSDPALSTLLASHARLLLAWPDAALEVMKFITLLRCSASSLAEALALGLMALAGSAAALSELGLRYRRTAINAIGHRKDGTEVEHPHAHLDEITCIEILDVTVDGFAGLRTAA